MNALNTGSERGTLLVVVALYGVRCSAPICTIARMSLMTCSFSTVNLLSRDKDLGVVRKNVQGNHGSLYYAPVYRVLLEFVDGFNVDESVSDQPVRHRATVFRTSISKTGQNAYCKI